MKEVPKMHMRSSSKIPNPVCRNPAISTNPVVSQEPETTNQKPETTKSVRDDDDNDKLQRSGKRSRSKAKYEDEKYYWSHIREIPMYSKANLDDIAKKTAKLAGYAERLRRGESDPSVTALFRMDFGGQYLEDSERRASRWRRFAGYPELSIVFGMGV